MRNSDFSIQFELPQKTQHRLALADDRTAWFEAIRDPHDPLFVDRRATAPLLATDYLSEYPAQEDYLLSQKRLSTMKAKIALFKNRQQQQAENERKRENFIKGLLG